MSILIVGGSGYIGSQTVKRVARAERVLLARFEELSRQWPCLLVAEGLGKYGHCILPFGTRAWVLTGRLTCSKNGGYQS